MKIKNKREEKKYEIKKLLSNLEDIHKIEDHIFMVYFDEMGLAEIIPK